MKDKKQLIRFAIILSIGLYFLFFNLASVFAETQTIVTTKMNNCFTIKHSFPNSTFENITAVTLPDQRVLIINKNMQSVGGGLYNYSFCNVTQSGRYSVDGVGNEDGSLATWTYLFDATPTGFANTIGFLSIFILVIALLFIMGMILKNAWVMMLGSILVLILGFFVIINGIDVIKDTTTTWAVGLIIWASGIYFTYLSVEEQLKLG